MRYLVQFGDERHHIDVSQDDHRNWQVRFDDRLLAVDRVDLGNGQISLLIDNRSYDLAVRPLPNEDPSTDAQRFDVVLDGVPRTIELIDERRRALTGAAQRREVTGDVTLKAPMPGLVVNILVAVGDIVENGQRIVVLEAMKMQNDLKAPRAGIVRAIKTEQGQAVNQNQPLVTISDAPNQHVATPADDDTGV